MYDFKNLESEDFEKLVGDILSEKYENSHIERFGKGPDGGIDLRFNYKSEEYIVQCKHYVGSTVSKLCSVLKNDELPKIKKLRPEKYLLFTSLKLMPSAKNAIVKALDNKITVNYIWGREELNDEIAKYSAVERRNYKLWFKSIAVLEQIINKKYVNKAQMSLERITQRINYYVEPDIFNLAYSILEDNNILIIKGNPGIGKSMLADALTLRYLWEKYEYYKIESINEFYQLYDGDNDRKQIFFFDDFLGQTEINSDFSSTFCRSMDDIYEHITKSTSGNKKFIMTTRNYILKSAKELKPETPSIFDSKFIIELGEQDAIRKCALFAKRLKYEKINCENIIKGEKYLSIINHKNFTPRIIDIVLMMMNKNGYDIYDKLIQSLDNPSDIWKDSVESLERNYESLIYILLLYNYGVNVKQLRKDYDNYNLARANHYNYEIIDNAFYKVLKDMYESFINIDTVYNQVKYINPSLDDYIKNRVDTTFSQDEFVMLLKSIGTYDATINLLTKTNIKANLIEWRELELLITNIMQNEFNQNLADTKMTIDKLERFIWSLVTDNSELFRMTVTSKYTYSEDIKGLIIKTVIGILNQDIKCGELFKVLEVIKTCIRGNLISIDAQKQAYESFCNNISDIIKEIDDDDYIDDLYIALYCCICVQFDFEINSVLDESVKQEVLKRKDGNIYRLFTVYDKDAISYIDAIGDHFGIDVSDSIIEFEEAYQDYQKMLDECRDDNDYYDSRQESKDSSSYPGTIKEVFEDILKNDLNA
ncbi:restriction endonuclease [Clostridium estertheticum]|uniref:nSTAND3 domain-containing NTPase n=1 Tax=Clostridium estertheticum TaxID=238834 RepID=UPI001C0D6990|nr:restriction endonuclease [Clostridium estertheticum]MBU3199489.1 restriction endonuclease [Clostridium estertheticum]WAG65433.1 restriction endonuclease [Clostridium estertheticum]